MKSSRVILLPTLFRNIRFVFPLVSFILFFLISGEVYRGVLRFQRRPHWRIHHQLWVYIFKTVTMIKISLRSLYCTQALKLRWFRDKWWVELSTLSLSKVILYLNFRFFVKIWNINYQKLWLYCVNSNIFFFLCFRSSGEGTSPVHLASTHTQIWRKRDR